MSGSTPGAADLCATLGQLFSKRGMQVGPDVGAAMLDDVMSLAPEELRIDLQLLRASLQPFVDDPQLTMGDWNRRHTREDVEELKQVSGRIASWVAANCKRSRSRPAAEQSASSVEDFVDAGRLQEILDDLVVACGQATGFEVRAHVADHDQLGVVAKIRTPSAATTEISRVWRWFHEQRNRTGLHPIVLTAEAVDMVEELGLDADEVAAAAEQLDPSTLLTIGGDARSWDHEGSSARSPATVESVDIAASVCGNDAALFLFPLDAGWKVAARLGLDDGGRFDPSEHVAILRHFEDEFGAVLAATSGAVTTLVLAEPVRDPARADRAARERLAYADTTSGSVEYEPEEVLAATLVDCVWSFWWD